MLPVETGLLGRRADVVARGATRIVSRRSVSAMALRCRAAVPSAPGAEAGAGAAAGVVVGVTLVRGVAAVLELVLAADDGVTMGAGLAAGAPVAGAPVAGPGAPVAGAPMAGAPVARSGAWLRPSGLPSPRSGAVPRTV
ncbi:MAG TPA: hypothetical protein VJZ50_05325, partial [Candidatus Limnocylindrales bacterium]|nr:hypothetical protein [Candidatus Limnocylindrales bacterium]